MNRNLSAIAKDLKRQAEIRLKKSLADLPAMILLTDSKRLANPSYVRDLLPEGSAIIFRHYDSPNREEEARLFLGLARELSCLFLVAGDPALAAKLNADGLHLPSYLLEKEAPDTSSFSLVTAAVHNEREIARAEALGCHLGLLSPVFPTPSHPDHPALGLNECARLVKKTTLPLLALGGVTDENASDLLQCGFAGIAGITVST